MAFQRKELKDSYNIRFPRPELLLFLSIFALFSDTISLHTRSVGICKVLSSHSATLEERELSSNNFFFAWFGYSAHLWINHCHLESMIIWLIYTHKCHVHLWGHKMEMSCILNLLKLEFRLLVLLCVCLFLLNTNTITKSWREGFSRHAKNTYPLRNPYNLWLKW